ncbi:MAG: hypothetical protein ABI780_01860 [Ardenticatenales bacterium]
MTTEQMRCCPNHPEYTGPLIGTFKFHGAEHWCPFCGFTTGSFFSDDSSKVAASTELVTRLAVYKAATEAYLRDIDGRVEWAYGTTAEGLPQPEADQDRPMITCDGCGRATPAQRSLGRCGGWEKPDHWFQRTRDGVTQTVCSKACADVVTDRTGGHRMILPW